MNTLPVHEGAWIVAGTESLTLTQQGLWLRREDGALFTPAEVNDFHGTSGYTVIE